MVEEQGKFETEREHHDRFAPVYDKYYVDTLHYVLLRTEFMEKIMKTHRPEQGVIVDLGAGTGQIAVPLHDSGYDVVAVDLSPGMLSQLTAKRPGIKTLVADASARLPFEDGSVGSVVINSTLHHLTDHEAVLREVRRILRPKGTLCICEPQLLPQALDFIRRIARKLLNPSGGHTPGEKPVDPGQLRTAVARYGFTVLSSTTSFFFPFNPSWRPARWLIRKSWRFPGRIPLVRRLGGMFMICAQKT